MTEETIIDGVDVSGCKYFQIEANTIYPKAHYCGSTFNRFCEDDENCVYKQLKRLEAENVMLKEEIIKLTEEIGNLIINRNTVENKLQDTESRLISVQKANTHNLVLLQRRNNALKEIRGISDNYNLTVSKRREQIANKINEVLKDE